MSNSDSYITSSQLSTPVSIDQLGLDIPGQDSDNEAGSSISMSGDGYTIAVAEKLDGASQTGLVRVYTWDPENDVATTSSWTQKGNDIVGLTIAEQFGTSVSISNDGNLLAVGSNFQFNNNKGGIKVYKWDPNLNNNNGDWTNTGELSAQGLSSNDRLGYSVSLSDDGTVLAVGAPGQANGAGNGYVDIYRYTTPDPSFPSASSWTGPQTITPPVSDNGNFGHSVSLSGDGSVLAIGEPKHGSGLVHVYKFNDGTSVFGLYQSDLLGSAGNNDDFGWSLSLDYDGDILVVGDPVSNNGSTEDTGSVEIFNDTGGENKFITEGGVVYGTSTQDNFGYSVAVNNAGSIFIGGSPQIDNNDSTALGKANVFYYLDNGTNKVWTQLGAGGNNNVIYNEGGGSTTNNGNGDILGEADDDQTGISVTMNALGDIFGTGANFNDTDNTTDNKGQARVFDSSTLSGTCFPGNTMIETDQEDIQIKDIDKDYHTINGKKIVAVTKIKLKKSQKVLIKINKDTFGTNQPFNDLYCTKAHKIYYEGKLIRATDILKKNIDGVSEVEYENQNLYNILFEDYGSFKANNLIVESLNPNDKIAKLYRSLLRVRN